MEKKSVTLLLLTCGTNACYHIAKRLKELYKDKIRIVGTDINQLWMIPAQPFLDAFYQCPLTVNGNYYDFILCVCTNEKVNYIMPSFDADQMLFYQGNPDLKKRSIISLGITQEVTAIYNSKEEMNLFLEKHQFPLPRFYKSSDVEDNKLYFCKPKNGVGSVGIRKMTGREIKSLDNMNMLIEEVCSAPEITLECFNYNGKIYSVARERLDTKAGVCTKARVYSDDRLQKIAQKFADTIKLPYIFNIQFMTNSEGKKVITDTNLRSAGGMSLSFAAGWDEVEALGKIMLGEKDVSSTLNTPDKDVYVVRAYTDIVTKTCKHKIAFDLDGTLLDSRKRHQLVMEYVLQEKGIHLDVSDLISYKAKGHNNLDWLKKKGIDVQVATDINKRWIALIEEEPFLNSDNLYDGVNKMLSELSKSNALYLVTARNNKQNAEQQISMLGLRAYFDGVYVVASSMHTSADKASILKQVGANIFIGDTESDLKAAQRVGIFFIASTFGFRSNEFWNKYGVEKKTGINDMLNYFKV